MLFSLKTTYYLEDRPSLITEAPDGSRECKRRDEFEEVLARYVDFYNNNRPCYAIGYDTSVNYRKRYDKGDLVRKKYI